MEKCEMKGCRNKSEMKYLGTRLCFKCWERVSESKCYRNICEDCRKLFPCGCGKHNGEC